VTILLSHIISARPSKQPLMVRTFLKVYMELGFYFLFLQEQIKDIIIMPTPNLIGSPSRHRGSVETRVTASWRGQDRDWSGHHGISDPEFDSPLPVFLLYPWASKCNLVGIQPIQPRLRMGCIAALPRLYRKGTCGPVPEGPRITHLSVESHSGIAPDPSLTNIYLMKPSAIRL